MELLPLKDARAQSFHCDWSKVAITLPEHSDPIVNPSVDLATLSNYIDWSPFLGLGTERSLSKNLNA